MVTNKKTTKNITKDFMRRLKKKKDKFKHLRSLGLVGTHRCNMNCSFCIWNKNRDEIMKKSLDVDLERFELLIKQAKFLNYDFISLTGGEIGLHPRFKELIKMICDYGFKFTYVTNGKNLDIYKFIFKNKKYSKQLESLAISLDGDEQTHDSKRGKGSYQNVMKAIDFYKSHKISVTIKCAIGQNNYKEFMHVIDLAHSLECDVEVFDLTDSPECLYSRHHREVIDIIKTNRGKIEKYWKKIDVNIKILPMFKGYDNCNFLQNMELVIHPAGEVYICCGQNYPEFSVGNINDDINILELLDKKRKKVKHIMGCFADMYLQPLSVRVNARDSCSFCKNFLSCKKDSGRVFHEMYDGSHRKVWKDD